MKFVLHSGQIEVEMTLSLTGSEKVINVPDNSDIGELQAAGNCRIAWSLNKVVIDGLTEVKGKVSLIGDEELEISRSGETNTALAADGDPVDVMVIERMPVQPGAMMAVRPIGVLELEDEAGGDEKILAVPTRKITQLYDRVKSWQDVPEIDLKRIQHFFEKWTRVGNWRDIDIDIAHGLINEAITRAKG